MSTVEIEIMRRCQDLTARGPVPAIARAYSGWGEHALGWIVVGCLGAVVDRRRRAVWIASASGAFAAHASAVVLKRVVRRRRPSDTALRVLARTPSDLSFPSAHAASTTAAAIALAPVVGPWPAAAGALTMGVARVILGVHYPSDVAVGVAIGLVTGRTTRRLLRMRVE